MFIQGFFRHSFIAMLATACGVASSASTAFGSLVGHWTFDEPSGSTVFDATGNHNDGTINGPVRVPGVVNCQEALSYNGTTDYVQVPDSASLSNMGTEVSISAWIWITPGTNYNPEGVSYRYIVAKGSTASEHADYGLLLTGNEQQTAGRIFFRYKSGLGQTTYGQGGNAPIPEGEWHLVTGTFNNGSVKVYVDRVLQGSGMGGTSTINSTPEPLFIGHQRLPAGNGGWDGKLDDVRIYNHELTQAEIDALPGPCAVPTTSWWGLVILLLIACSAGAIIFERARRTALCG